ncbi:hypothetical protein TNCV_2987731, partial [Trichonephila clavipes]
VETKDPIVSIIRLSLRCEDFAVEKLTFEEVGIASFTSSFERKRIDL